ncbi:hypothetical protein GC169_01435 [bacterium]|nr:hypothetical protein [bacterium]
MRLKPAFAALALCLTLASGLSATFAGAAHAGPQFVDKAGVANFGYDVVAYHTSFSAIKGKAEFSATHNGVPFWFASAANRDAFTRNPTAFAPAYDGHCAYALSNDKKLTVDPEAFSIVDKKTGKLVDRAAYTPGTGTLYLNYSPSVNGQFNKDVAGTISRADFAWKDCLEKRPAAKPNKGLSDLIPGSRPKDCPKG